MLSLLHFYRCRDPKNTIQINESFKTLEVYSIDPKMGQNNRYFLQIELVDLYVQEFPTIVIRQSRDSPCI